MTHIEHFTFNSFYTNCYVIWDETGKCAIVDPGCGSEEDGGYHLARYRRNQAAHQRFRRRAPG